MTSKKKLLMVRVTARDARTMRALLGDHPLDVTCGGPQGIADGGVVFNAQIEAVAEALDRVEQTGERIWEAERHRLKGRLIRDQGQASPAPGIPAKAEECVQQALAIGREQGVRSLDLRAAVSLARLWHQHGKTAAARQALAEICDWFTEGFETADLKEARALLGELSSR